MICAFSLAHPVDAARKRLAVLSEEALLPDTAKILTNPATPLVVVCDTDKIALTLFAISFLALGYLGLQPAEGKYVIVARLFTVLYFAFFWLMPVYSRVEAVHDRDFLAQFHSGAYGRRTDNTSSGTRSLAPARLVARGSVSVSFGHNASGRMGGAFVTFCGILSVAAPGKRHRTAGDRRAAHDAGQIRDFQSQVHIPGSPS